MARRTATFSLTAKLKRKWIKALRSGKFKQTTDALIGENGGYCCLGVLCKIQGASDSSLIGKQYPQEAGMFEELTPDAEEMFNPYANPEEQAFAVLFNGELTPLSVLNDNGKTFAQIANIIERRVPTH